MSAAADEAGCDSDAGSGEDGSSTSSSATLPLHRSSRLKGYVTLFVSSLFNYISATELLQLTKGAEGGIETVAELEDFLCAVDNLGDLVHRGKANQHRLRLSIACSVITM